jgi:hypothetical protein
MKIGEKRTVLAAKKQQHQTLVVLRAIGKNRRQGKKSVTKLIFVIRNNYHQILFFCKYNKTSRLSPMRANKNQTIKQTDIREKIKGNESPLLRIRITPPRQAGVDS